MTNKELQERIYGDYYKSQEERDAFILDYLRNYKAPKLKFSQEEKERASKIVDDVFKKVCHEQAKRNQMRALAMERALRTRVSI